MRIVPFYTLFNKEIKRFMRIFGQSLVTPLVTTFLYLFIFGIGLGGQIHVQDEVSYLQFLIPGLIMMGIINNSFMNPSFSLMLSKIYGDIEDLKTTPLTTNSIIWSMTFAATIRGILVGVIIFFLSECFIFFNDKTFISPQNIPYLLIISTAAAITFSLIGFTSGMISKNFETLNAIVQFIILPLVYLGGVFFSLENLHPFWQTFSKFNPIFYYINGMRLAFIGTSDVAISYVILASLIFLIISYFIAFWVGKKATYKHIG